MKNQYHYAKLSLIEIQIVAFCYRRILKHIEKTKYDANLSTLKAYYCFVKDGEIKPANISRFLLTPYWNEICNMWETKILIRTLKKHS